MLQLVVAQPTKVCIAFQDSIKRKKLSDQVRRTSNSSIDSHIGGMTCKFIIFLCSKASNKLFFDHNVKLHTELYAL